MDGRSQWGGAGGSGAGSAAGEEQAEAGDEGADQAEAPARARYIIGHEVRIGRPVGGLSAAALL